MSPAAGMMLTNEIVPILNATVPRVVKAIGSEDPEELVQDAVASAAQFVDSLERRGRPIYPQSVAYFSIQRSKSGRRSYSASRMDALCPAAQLDSTVALAHLDAEISLPASDTTTLHDMLADTKEDPAQRAARELDWGALLASLSRRDRAIVRKTAEEASLGSMAGQFRVSTARICQLRRELGSKVRALMGEQALADSVRVPAWQSSLRVVREREACRWGRAQREQ